MGTLATVGDQRATSRATRILAWAAALGISSAVLIIIAVSAVRNSWSIPRIAMPATGPPWQLSIHLPRELLIVTVAMWAATLLGGGGMAAGLIAVARGARPPVRLLIAGSLAAVAALVVLPPTGSTDALDYAAYGRIAVLGHSPYVMTPRHLHRIGDPVGRTVPRQWEHSVSIYGPAASTEQHAAAQVGGPSTARIIFWLKLWNALAFCAVLLILDRLLRADPARRARAHLLWSVNPLLLWGLIAAGHVEVMSAAAGLLGLVALGGAAKSGHARLPRALIAGFLVGIAADFKVTYLLFAAGIGWATRRSPVALLTAAAAVLAVLVPSYLWFGPKAFKVLLADDNRTDVSSFYRLLGAAAGPSPVVFVVSVLAFLVVGALTLRRLPDGVPGLPAIQPALALSVAWLFLWPYQNPWYDTMAICLLALYPASRLDWLVLVHLTASTFAAMPGAGQLQWRVPPLTEFGTAVIERYAPVVSLAVAAGLMWLAVSGDWNMRPPLLRGQEALPQLTADRWGEPTLTRHTGQ